MLTLPHGTQIETRDDHPTRATDPGGTTLWQVRWRGAAIDNITFVLPDRTRLFVTAAAGCHPLFGTCDAIGRGAASGSSPPAPLALVCATAWTDPTWIPPVDRPAALPPGTGSALLNMLSICARHRGRDALQYRGPYPTAALFETLRGSFRPHGHDEASAAKRFTDNVENRALVGRMEAVDVRFAPAPHEWAFVAPGVCLQRRDGLERVYVEGRSYRAGPPGDGCRLRPSDDGWTACIVIAGEPWHDVLQLDRAGNPTGAIQALPTDSHELDGAPLPEGLGPLLGSVLAERAPTLLQPAIEDLLDRQPLHWGATGLVLAEAAADRIVLHSVLGQRLLTRAPAEMLDHLVAALEPLVRRLAQERVAATHAAL